MYVCICVCANVAQSCLTLCNPMDWSPLVLCPWDSPGKNTRVGCHALLQAIFLTQGSNPHLLHWQGGSLPPSHQGSPMLHIVVCILFSLWPHYTPCGILVPQPGNQMQALAVKTFRPLHWTVKKFLCDLYFLIPYP